MIRVSGKQAKAQASVPRWARGRAAADAAAGAVGPVGSRQGPPRGRRGRSLVATFLGRKTVIGATNDKALMRVARLL